MPITLNSSFSDIADAIRELNWTSNTYTPGQMAAEIIRYKDPSYILPTVSSINEISNPSSVWKSGTDQDVLNMVGLAMRGDIDLTNYWSVGDTRTVSISAMSATDAESHAAQTVEMVLMHANPSKYTYVTTPISGRTKPYFIYGQKNSLINGGPMNPSNTNLGSWNGCPRRTWCNNVYRNAVPTYLKTITKQVKVITAQRYDGSTNQTSQDYFFLAAAKEIIGGNATSAGAGTGYSNLTEYQALEQWTWYATVANRIKTRSGVGAAPWWLRGPAYTLNSIFCYVDANGSANGYYANNPYGLAPCGCI